MTANRVAIAELARRRLIVVTGKGGVGKSAVTAALGRVLARAGRRTLVLEVDPRENLHRLLDVPPSGGEAVAAGERLWLQNLKPRDVVDWVVERQVKIGLIVDRVLESPVYQRFAEGAPGLKEMAILGHALRIVEGDRRELPKIDTVILDAPATGHGVYLLTAPRLFAEAVGEGPIAELAEEVAAFVADPEATSIVVVTLAEEMPVEEALELRTALAERFGREPALLVVNALYPPAAGDGKGSLVTLWRERRAVNDAELARLARDWSGPRVELPLLAIDGGGRLVDALATRLGEALR